MMIKQAIWNIFNTPRRWHWKLEERWFDTREARFVRDCQFYLDEYDVLYVHPGPDLPATTMALYALTEEGCSDLWNHTHVEGGS